MHYSFKYSNIYTFLAINIFFLFTACAPSVRITLTDSSSSYSVIEYDQEIIVLDLHTEIPSEATVTVIGEVKIYDSGFTTDCDYKTVIEKARLEARKKGGNAIKITSHKEPGFMSTCHQVTANILRRRNIEEFTELNPLVEEVFEGDYALVYIYRLSGPGSLIAYDVYFNDIEICRISNKSKTEVKINDESPGILWAQTETKTKLPVEFKHGRKYYIRCGLKTGAFIGRPIIELVDARTGKTEYELIQNKRVKVIEE